MGIVEEDKERGAARGRAELSEHRHEPGEAAGFVGLARIVEYAHVRAEVLQDCVPRPEWRCVTVGPSAAGGDATPATAGNQGDFFGEPGFADTRGPPQHRDLRKACAGFVQQPDQPSKLGASTDERRVRKPRGHHLMLQGGPRLYLADSGKRSQAEWQAIGNRIIESIVVK